MYLALNRSSGTKISHVGRYTEEISHRDIALVTQNTGYQRCIDVDDVLPAFASDCSVSLGLEFTLACDAYSQGRDA